MKHVHYEKIVAKAENMELVVFERQNTATHEKEEYKPIQPDGNRAIWFHEDADYFLCLPQHKEVVIRGLNGEVVESTNEDRDGWSESSVELWDKDWWYMLDNYTSRIKPKKEKRWIIISNGVPLELIIDSKCKPYRAMINGDQAIEIEVEV